MSYVSIAIDGPAGAGKSTIAKRISSALGFIYVDTGALYRAVGLYAAQKGADTNDAEQVLPLLKEIELELTFIDGAQRVILNKEDISELIRTPEISMYASNVSAISGVRDFLFGLQREIAAKNSVVMDGRDIGTVILPDASVKIFLTASPEERANRRYKEHLERGETVEYLDLLAQIKQRDYNDSHREARPLKQAEDAVLVDTTGLPLEESVDLLMGIVSIKLECDE